MNGLQDALLNLFMAVLTVAATAIAKSVTTYLKNKGAVDVLVKKEKSVKIAVKAVEQIARNENVPNKFTEAKRRARRLLAKQNIVISEEELEDLIESVVDGFNAGVKEGLE